MKRISEKEIFKTKLFTIKDINLLTDKGNQVTYQIIEKPDGSLIVPLLEDGSVVFIEEYFYAIDEYQLGLLKGRIEAGENEFTTANKELQEEIGFKAQKLDKLATVTMSPGYNTQKTHLFLARNLVESKLKGDEEYEIKIIKYPLDKFEDLIDQNKLVESRMIAALYLSRRFLEKEK